MLNSLSLKTRSTEIRPSSALPSRSSLVAQEQNPSPHRLFLGFDSRSMRAVDDETVHLVVTSPPYWNIKDYGNPRQIGYRDSLQIYIQKLSRVWDECLRALKPGCRMCINIGDEYIRAEEKTPYQIIPLHSYLVNSIILPKFQRKKALYLGSIIWQKIPTTKTSGGASVMGSYGYPRNGYVSYNFEYIAIFKKRGHAPKPPEDKENAKIDLPGWRELFNGVWRFNGVRQTAGTAIFPDELPRRLIRMFTYEGDTVLDPFLGTGTTTKVAMQMKRRSIGYEIGFRSPMEEEDWTEVVKKKVGYYDLPSNVRDQTFDIQRRESLS
jgi:modification methylase